MAVDHWAETQSPTLQWNVQDTFLIGQVPTQYLRWVYDPTVSTLVHGDDEGWSSLMIRYTAKIRNLGFHNPAERAAISIIISLIPNLRGAITARFKERVSGLFDIAGEYLSSTKDVLVLNSFCSLNLQKIVMGNLFRALLDDALADTQSIEAWGKKAVLFLEWSGVEDGKKRQIWNETIFPELGWPTTLRHGAYPGPTEAPLRPDFLTALCLLGKHDHAYELIGHGYDLNTFLLFNFQSFIWRNTGCGPSSLDVLPDYFEEAEARLDRILSDPVEPPETEVWHHYVWQKTRRVNREKFAADLSIEDCKALKVLYFLADKGDLDPSTGVAVTAAMRYLARTDELSLPDYLPVDSDD